MQALFTGYKCTKCACGYSLPGTTPLRTSLPIPDDVQRVMTVHVFPKGISYGTMLSVIVDRDGTLMDIVNAFCLPTSSPHCLASRLLRTESPSIRCRGSPASIIRGSYPMTRKLRDIRDTDFVFFYEVTREASADKEARLQLDESHKEIVSQGVDAEGDKDVNDASDTEGSMFRDRGHDIGSDKVENVENIRSSRSRATEDKPRDVKVCFVQRQATWRHKIMDSFTLDIFGLPFISDKQHRHWRRVI